MKHTRPEKWGNLNNTLVTLSPGLENRGLFRGKMGICLYFFHLANKTGNTSYEEFADQLLQDVFQYIHQNPIPPHFDNGLAGIAWAIEYLIKKDYIEADPDIALIEVDNVIYKAIIEHLPEMSFGVKQGILGYILYVLSRMTDKDNNLRTTEQSLIFERLLIALINWMGKMIEDDKVDFKEPIGFDIFWDLPCCLHILSKIKELNFYHSKTTTILKHLSSKVLSTFPQYQSNQLSLIYALECIGLPE